MRRLMIGLVALALTAMLTTSTMAQWGRRGRYNRPQYRAAPQYQRGPGYSNFRQNQINPQYQAIPRTDYIQPPNINPPNIGGAHLSEPGFRSPYGAANNFNSGYPATPYGPPLPNGTSFQQRPGIYSPYGNYYAPNRGRFWFSSPAFGIRIGR